MKTNKDKLLQIRIDSKTMNKLDTLCEVYDLNRSKMLRKLIDIRHNKLKGIGVKDKNDMKQFISAEIERISKMQKKLVDEKLNRLLSDTEK